MGDGISLRWEEMQLLCVIVPFFKKDSNKSSPAQRTSISLWLLSRDEGDGPAVRQLKPEDLPRAIAPFHNPKVPPRCHNCHKQCHHDGSPF